MGRVGMARPISLLGTIVQIFGRRVSDVVVLEQIFQLLYSFLEVKDVTGTARRQYFLLFINRKRSGGEDGLWREPQIGSRPGGF